MNDSNGSIEDEDVFSLILMRAKTKLPTRHLLAKAKTGDGPLKVPGTVLRDVKNLKREESDSHTLLL